MSGAREVARLVVRRAASSDAFATLALSGEIDRAGLEGRDAAFATELALGTLRNQRRLDVALAAYSKSGKVDASSKVRAILRVAAYEILFCAGVPARASVNEAAAAARKVAGSKVAGFANALLRRLADGGEPELPRSTRQRLCIEHSIPDWIFDELTAALPDASEIGPACAAMSAVPPICLRPNPLRTNAAELTERLAREVPTATVESHPFVETGLRARGLGAIANLPSFREGLFTVQDAGAQRVTELAPRTGVDTILDACAGVGGKTTHLAEFYADSVAIDAADVSASKLEKALESAKRLGLSSIRETIACDLTVEPVASEYDLVVLDAPCSGLGVLRRHPEAKWRLGPKQSPKMAKLQKSLLEACAKSVRRGGHLIYAVCTFCRREGAEQIASFTENSSFELEIEMTSWPHKHDADAFYAARLLRR